MAITFRRNKSVPLTFEELDGNFDDVNNRVATIEGNYAISVNGFKNAVTLGTDNISEGSTNLYYTEARFNTSFGNKSTNDLAEGTGGSPNLYYTDARVGTAVNALSVDALSDVDTTTVAPTLSDVLTWDGTNFKPLAAPGASGGEANLGSNVGTGVNVFKQKASTTLEFNTIRAVAQPIVVAQNTGANTVDLSFVPSGDVDFLTNKIVNVGAPTAGTDAANKTYVDGLAGSGTLSIIDDAAATITVDLSTQNLTLAGTANQITSTASGQTVTLSLPSTINVQAQTATALHTSRDIVLTGAVSGTGNFDGSANVSIATTLAGTITLGTDTTGSYVATVAGGTGITVTGGGAGEGTTPSIALDSSASPTFTDLTLSGNLTVNGTTTTVATTNTTISDSILELATGTTGSAANDAGIVIERGDDANAFIGYDESADEFTVGTGTFTGASTGNLSITAGTFNAGTLKAGNLSVTANTIASASGDIVLSATGDIDANTNKIKGLVDPTGAQEAATKSYVDTQIATVGSTFNIASDSGTDVITTGADTLTFTGGSGIDTSITGDTVTFALNGSGVSVENSTKTDRVAITEDSTTNGTHYVHFGDANSGYDGVKTDSAVFSYNPGTETLAVTNTTTVSSSAQYADLAEKYTADKDYAPGTVMEIDGVYSDAETTAWAGSPYVAGVVSTNPAYLMNSELDGISLALVGRVPVRVIGAINKGQAVFAHADGCASSDGAGPLVGIAIETNADADEKLVECMLKV